MLCRESMMHGNEIRVIDGEDIRRALPKVDAIEAMKEAKEAEI